MQQPLGFVVETLEWQILGAPLTGFRYVMISLFHVLRSSTRERTPACRDADPRRSVASLGGTYVMLNPSETSTTQVGQGTRLENSNRCSVMSAADSA